MPSLAPGSPTGRARLLAVVIGKGYALPGNAVDVRRLVAHQASGVSADVALTDVVAPYDKDIGLFGSQCRRTE